MTSAGGTMAGDLVTNVLPVLGRSLEPRFNVFDVMHHGLHEKQISNVFRWLLNRDGTHRLGDRFVRIFIEEVNSALGAQEGFADTGYSVRQEQNTVLSQEEGADIADLILESADAVLVIENYFTSDGHGHSFDGYLQYGQRHGKRAAVVMLCRDVDRSLLSTAWSQAAVVTYRQLAMRLHEAVRRDAQYQALNPHAFSFIEQLRWKFDQEAQIVEDQDVLDFVVAMCKGDQANRYGKSPHRVAAEQFSIDVAAQAARRFEDGRALLERIRSLLKTYAERVLVPQLNDATGEVLARAVSVGNSGLYLWTITIAIDGDLVGSPVSRAQLKFGPSAWHAIEADPAWQGAYSGDEPDYSKIFLTLDNPLRVRPTGVAIAEVLDGIAADDTRLRDAILKLLGGSRSR